MFVYKSSVTKNGFIRNNENIKGLEVVLNRFLIIFPNAYENNNSTYSGTAIIMIQIPPSILQTMRSMVITKKSSSVLLKSVKILFTDFFMLYPAIKPIDKGTPMNNINPYSVSYKTTKHIEINTLNVDRKTTLPVLFIRTTGSLLSNGFSEIFMPANFLSKLIENSEKIKNIFKVALCRLPGLVSGYLCFDILCLFGVYWKSHSCLRQKVLQLIRKRLHGYPESSCVCLSNYTLG